MTTPNKHLLVVCYNFPPNEGIGGRRWAKLAKAFAGRGYTVHVIKADPVDSSLKSSWSEDVHHPNIILHSLPRKYPHVVSHPRHSLLSKLKYRMAIRSLMKREAGTVYDISIGWEKTFAEKAKEILQSFNVKTVLVTGAPFNLFVYASRLKSQGLNFQLLCDYRDPWLDADNLGMKNLSAERRKAEENKQRFVFEHADFITAPNEYMIDFLQDWSKKNSIHQPHFMALPHFYDDEDKVSVTAHSSKDKIIGVYGGEIYQGFEPYLEQMESWLDQLRLLKSEVYQRLEFKVFTNANYFILPLQRHQQVWKWEKTIGKSFFNELVNADFAFIFLAEHNRQFKTTKFFEYMPYRKPYVYVGAQGDVAAFIENEKMGFVVKEIATDMDRLIQSIDSGEFQKHFTFDPTPFSLHAACDKLCNLLHLPL